MPVAEMIIGVGGLDLTGRAAVFVNSSGSTKAVGAFTNPTVRLALLAAVHAAIITWESISVLYTFESACLFPPNKKDPEPWPRVLHVTDSAEARSRPYHPYRPCRGA